MAGNAASLQSSRSSPEHDLLFVMAALGPGHPRLSACCYPTWMAGIANKLTPSAHGRLLERFRTKWIPVRVKKRVKTKD